MIIIIRPKSNKNKKIIVKTCIKCIQSFHQFYSTGNVVAVKLLYCESLSSNQNMIHDFHSNTKFMFIDAQQPIQASIT